jgi:D-alanyl-D-alanine dipeptidase
MSERLHPAPIPEQDTPSWGAVHGVPIVECGEELVPLSLAPERVLVRPAYFCAGLQGALPECYAREGVLDRLMHAASMLPDGVRMVVLDAWRSIGVQEILFEQCLAVLRGAHPDLGEQDLASLVRQFVASPSADRAAPSPHLTGGALDLTLATVDGKLLEFGTPFDYPGPASYTRHLERKAAEEPLYSREREGLENRRLLYEVMIRAGFVNLHAEWWHFEYGTQRWALLTGADQARYGGADRSRNGFAALLEGSGGKG